MYAIGTEDRQGKAKSSRVGVKTISGDLVTRVLYRCEQGQKRLGDLL